MEQKIHYVGLLLLIIFGVTVGNLVSSWLVAKYSYVEPEKETIAAPEVLSETPSMRTKAPELKETPKSETPEFVRETVKLSPDNQTEADEINPPVDSMQLIDQRKQDEIGLRLAKQCNEWTIVHKDMNTLSSERGMNRHCAEYYDYLSFGTLPNSN